MADVREEWNGEKYIRNIRIVLARRLEKCAQLVHRTAKRNIGAIFRGPPYGHGYLRGSMAYQVYPEILTARIGTDWPHARVQEEGAWISAKRRRSLAVPIDPSAVRASKTGASVGQLFPRLLRIDRAGRPPLLVQNLTPKGRHVRKVWKIMYVLPQRVYVPPRPYLRPALAECKPQIAAILSAPVDWRRESGG